MSEHITSYTIDEAPISSDDTLAINMKDYKQRYLFYHCTDDVIICIKDKVS